jgi:transglutaminase-like putative cysteine protease
VTRYRLRHRTAYTYARPVDLAAHLLHLSPRMLPGQRVMEAAVTCLPDPAHRREGQDHFGNGVTWLFLEAPHAAFEVILEAEVEVGFAAPPADAATLPWEDVRDAALSPAGWEATEFVLPSVHAPLDRAAAQYVRQSFPPGRPVLAGLREVIRRIKRDFAFRPGATTVSTPVAQVMATRAGVCQDYAHAMIAGLRAIGLPARYVSGYVRTRPPPGRARLQGADASHAWVGAWLGPAQGWVDLDPTNDLVLAQDHVVLGWGRDFADVSPVQGQLLGGGRQALVVGVDLIPG